MTKLEKLIERLNDEDYNLVCWLEDNDPEPHLNCDRVVTIYLTKNAN